MSPPVAGPAAKQSRSNKRTQRAGRFTGKVAVVTGAAQGIGRDVALCLAQEGAKVVLSDRSEFVHEAAAEAGGLAVIADMEKYADCTGLIASAIAKYGPIDVLINNVGGTIWSRPFADYTEPQIEAEIRRSLFPTLYCCHAVLPGMIAAGKGSIVNISSVATRGLNRVPYAAAKGGINAMTVGLAWEYAEAGIRVNAVAPGMTDAPPRRIPRQTGPGTQHDIDGFKVVAAQSIATTFMKRAGTMAEQTAAILFLASDEASYITGTILPVAGGDQG